MELATGKRNVPTDALRLNAAAREDRKGPDDFLDASVREIGVLSPLIVRTDGTIIDGRRRWEVAKRIGLAEVPCRVLDVSDEQALEVALTRSVEFVPVKPVEFSRQLRRLVDANPTMPRAELARKTGTSVGWVAKRLTLVELCAEAAAALDAGRIPLETAFLLAALDHDRQHALLDDARTLTAADFKRLHG